MRSSPERCVNIMRKGKSQETETVSSLRAVKERRSGGLCHNHNRHFAAITILVLSGTNYFSIQHFIMTLSDRPVSLSHFLDEEMGPEGGDSPRPSNYSQNERAGAGGPLHKVSAPDRTLCQGPRT